MLPFEDDQPASAPLDPDHVLEPIAAAAGEPWLGEPMVRDVRGRLWRVRRRAPSRELTMLVAVSALVTALLLLWLLIAI